MKKVTQINLRDEFFVVHEDHVDQRLSDDRTWFEVRGVKVKSLELDDENDQVIANKGLADEQKMNLNEDVFTSEGEAKILAKNMNEKEQDQEAKVMKDLEKRLDASKKLYEFYKDLKKELALND